MFLRNEPSESVAWINEERMKIWQIELYHRVTEDNGVNATKSTTYERGGSLRDRSSIRPREVLDPSPDYTPEKNIPTRARPHPDSQYRETTMSVSFIKVLIKKITFYSCKFLFLEQYPGLAQQIPPFAACSHYPPSRPNPETGELFC